MTQDTEARRLAERVINVETNSAHDAVYVARHLLALLERTRLTASDEITLRLARSYDLREGTLEKKLLAIIDRITQPKATPAPARDETDHMLYRRWHDRCLKAEGRLLRILQGFVNDVSQEVLADPQSTPIFVAAAHRARPNVIGCEAARVELAKIGQEMGDYDPPQPEPSGGWQDIASAPKDGTWVLMVIPFSPVTITVGAYDNSPEKPHWASWRYNGDDGPCDITPTHWMPLPAPPVTTAPAVDGEGENNV